MLGVHLQHFQNLYNAEFRDSGKYCCCDISYLDVPCGKNLTDLNTTACSTSACDPYFEMGFEVCFGNGTCLYKKNEITCVNNITSTCISPLLFQLHSNASMIDNTTNVSAKTECSLYKNGFK